MLGMRRNERVVQIGDYPRRRRPRPVLPMHPRPNPRRRVSAKDACESHRFAPLHVLADRGQRQAEAVPPLVGEFVVMLLD